MLTYFIIAASFSISSLWFIHKRALAMYNMIDYPIIYDISYLVMTIILFPLMLFFWLIDSEEVIKRYGKNLSEAMKENED